MSAIERGIYTEAKLTDIFPNINKATDVELKEIERRVLNMRAKGIDDHTEYGATGRIEELYRDGDKVLVTLKFWTIRRDCVVSTIEFL